MTERRPVLRRARPRERRGRWSSSRSATGASRSPSRARPGGRVVGIDTSPAMLAQARERVAQAGVDARAARRRHARTRAGRARRRSIYCPFRSLVTPADVGRPAARLRARPASLRPGRSLRLELRSSSIRRHRGPHRRRVAGAERDPAPSSTRSSTTTALDVTLESGDAISLWWLNRSEWEGLIEVAGFEVEALYGGFERQPFDENATEFVWVVRKPVVSTTRSRGSTTRGARASPRTWSSTWRRRARPAARSSSSACGTGRISIPIAKAGIRLIGVDASAGMLEVAEEYGRAEGVGELARSPARRHARPAGDRARAARADPVPLAAAHDDRGRPPPGARRRPGAAGRRRADRLRRLRAESRGRSGHARPLDRARARDLRARRLGRGQPNADALRTPGRGGLDHASRLALAARMAHAARPRRLRRRMRSGAGSTAARTAAARTLCSRVRGASRVDACSSGSCSRSRSCSCSS